MCAAAHLQHPAGHRLLPLMFTLSTCGGDNRFSATLAFSTFVFATLGAAITIGLSRAGTWGTVLAVILCLVLSAIGTFVIFAGLGRSAL